MIVGMKLALVQFNPTIGDLEGNAAEIVSRVEAARGLGAEVVVFPELSVCGYPPRDLLEQEGFVEDVHGVVGRLAARLAPGVTVIVGAPWKGPRTTDADGGSAGAGAFDARVRPTNSLLVLRGGTILARYDKRLLPTYDVFDEDRYFRAGSAPVVVEAGGVRIGLSVCEDLWKGVDAMASDRYASCADPVEELVRAGAELIVNPSASPFVLGKHARQRAILRGHVERWGVAIAAVNQVGGNDDLLFDGHAAVYAPVRAEGGGGCAARLVASAPGFCEHTVVVDVPARGAGWEGHDACADALSDAPEMELLFRALVIGVRDYCGKTGFGRVLLGVSGGIDSAVVACIAAAAVGAENVLGLGLPSRYSSEGSLTDAAALARNLGIGHDVVSIESAHSVVERDILTAIERVSGAQPDDLTGQNVQSRLRGLTLMAFSNAMGSLLLTTGNKSELAVGYCTLYGDMNGGLAVLSDVTKGRVYELSRWINANFAACGFGCAPIPGSTITKPPSAELKPDQTDQDTLPPYEALDAVVERYVDRLESGERIVRETGLDAEVVRRIIRMIDVNEHKRKQLPIGLKVTGVAFGRGRRRPLAQRYPGRF